MPGTFALSDFQAGCQGEGARLLRRAAQKAIGWSGGTTTEIAIYPADSAYSRRDFLWRASSATVEADESEFTSLPGFWRLIMVLEGELQLEHAGHHRARLLPFEQDAFDGAWITRSRGKARDFNLMLAEGCTGNLQAIPLPGRSTIDVLDAMAPVRAVHHCTWRLVYAVDGSITVRGGAGAAWRLDAGDALLLTIASLQRSTGLAFAAEGETPVQVVLASIWSSGIR
ncbi:MAG: HutD family protein [Candidatus Cryosericum sp.]